jgi:hypothetical protein
MAKNETEKIDFFVKTTNEKQNNSTTKTADDTIKISSVNTVAPALNTTKSFIKVLNPNDPNYKKRIILNARGTRYEVLMRIFDKYPQSRLGKIKKLIEIGDNNRSNNDLIDLCDDFDLGKSEFYFNRDPYILNFVINFYEDSKIHYDDKICSKFFLHEIKYWGLNEFLFDNDCKCQINFFIQREECSENSENQEKVIDDIYNKENFGCFLPKIREYIWGIIDRPADPSITKVIRPNVKYILNFLIN